MIICVPVSLLAARRSKLDEINAHDEKTKEQMAFAQDAAIQSSKLADAQWVIELKNCELDTEHAARLSMSSDLANSHLEIAGMMQQIRALKETVLEDESMQETAEPLETPLKNRHYREPLKNH